MEKTGKYLGRRGRLTGADDGRDEHVQFLFQDFIQVGGIVDDLVDQLAGAVPLLVEVGTAMAQDLEQLSKEDMGVAWAARAFQTI